MMKPSFWRLVSDCIHWRGVCPGVCLCVLVCVSVHSQWVLACEHLQRLRKASSKPCTASLALICRCTCLWRADHGLCFCWIYSPETAEEDNREERKCYSPHFILFCFFTTCRIFKSLFKSRHGTKRYDKSSGQVVSVSERRLKANAAWNKIINGASVDFTQNRQTCTKRKSWKMHKFMFGSFSWFLPWLFSISSLYVPFLQSMLKTWNLKRRAAQKLLETERGGGTGKSEGKTSQS